MAFFRMVIIKYTRNSKHLANLKKKIGWLDFPWDRQEQHLEAWMSIQKAIPQVESEKTPDIPKL